MAAGDLTAEQEDAVVNGVVTTYVNRGFRIDDLVEPGTPARQTVDDALDRHAARQRAAGKPGW